MNLYMLVQRLQNQATHVNKLTIVARQLQKPLYCEPGQTIAGYIVALSTTTNRLYLWLVQKDTTTRVGPIIIITNTCLKGSLIQVTRCVPAAPHQTEYA